MDSEEFHEYITEYGNYCYSQLGQDLWVLAMLGHPTTGYFVEIGASDGLTINNTYLLEQSGWRGIAVEPNPYFFGRLQKNRTADLVNRCVWTTDDQQVEFHHVKTMPELSHMTISAPNDQHHLTGRRAHFEVVRSVTMQPSTLLETYSAPDVIDYLTLDIEGGELPVLQAFPFDRYTVRLISVEHNHTEMREPIQQLLESKGFVRVLTEHSNFDDWYVHPAHVKPCSWRDTADGFYAGLAAAGRPEKPVSVDVYPFLLGHARSLVARKRNGDAGRLLRTFLTLHPCHAEITVALAKIEVAEGRPDTAEKLLLDIIQSAPHMIEPQVGLAEICLQQGRAEEALAYAQSVVDRIADHRGAMLIATRALSQLQRMPECVRMALKVIRNGALPKPFLMGLTKRLGARDLRPEAISLLRAALTVSPNDADINAALLDNLIAWRADERAVRDMPKGNEFEARIEIANEGRACVATVPKVAGAGEIVTDESGAEFQRMFEGTLVTKDGYYGEWMTRLIAGLDGHHEPQEELVFAEVLKQVSPGSTMLELGSYWGFYSTAFLRHLDGNATATLIEPDLKNAALALETLRINNQTATVQLGAVPPMPPELGEQEVGFGAKIKTPVFNIQKFMTAMGDRELTILHADIQGAETTLLREVEALLARQAIKYLFISTHGPGKHVQCLRAIKAAGYLLVAEHDCFESYSFDGLVVARAPGTDLPGYIDLPVRGGVDPLVDAPPLAVHANGSSASSDGQHMHI